MTTIQRSVRGRFDLRQSIDFGFGPRVAERGEVMRLAVVLDGYDAAAGVAVTQPAPDRVSLVVTGDGVDAERAADQAMRVLSLDHDATSYDDLVERDPVLRGAWADRPGLRPPLFQSAYEALVWAVLSARRPAAQMRQVRERIAREHGTVLDVAGETLAAFPTPARLLGLRELDGVPEVKLRRMHAIAKAARDGRIDTLELRALDLADATALLRGFEGIGPFYSELVTMRTLGHTDVLPVTEGRVIAATAARLGRSQLSVEEFAEVAEAWRPWRSWACVAIRAAG